MAELDPLLAIAQIAGVFVGFGALISVSSDQAGSARVALRGVVTIGLVVLVAALLPVGLARYALPGDVLWRGASAGFLVLVWLALHMLLASPEHRAWMGRDAKEHPAFTVFFWIFLEVPIQAALVLALIGVAPTYAAALYVTALLLNLFEAALLLARLVVARSWQGA